MKDRIICTLALAATLVPLASRAEEESPWSFDASIYGLLASMSGNVAVKGIPADVNVGFEHIWDNLKFGGMGTARVGYGKWALSSDVIYMDLEMSKGAVSAEAQQWMVQPALEHTFNQYFGLYAGARYNNLHLALHGPLDVNPSGTQEWWDPVMGARLAVPVWKKLSFHVAGDIGGFDVGSQLTWQAYPYFNWQFSKLASVQAGYRLLYTDYENGSGRSYFKYDVLSYGPQIGFTVHF